MAARHGKAGLAGVTLLLAAWSTLPSPEGVIPPLFDVIARGWEMALEGRLWLDLSASLWRILVGAAIGISCSVAIGILCIVPIVRASLAGLIELTRPIPPIAWIPLMLVLFGVGDSAAIAIVAFAVFFPVIVSIILALDSIDPDLVLVSRSLGADWRFRIQHVYLPSMTPTLVAGIRLGIGIGWFSVVAAEMVGSYGGLGYGIQIASLNLEMERFFVYLTTIGVCGLIMNSGMLWIGERLTPWRQGTGHVE